MPKKSAKKGKRAKRTTKGAASAGKRRAPVAKRRKAASASPKKTARKVAKKSRSRVAKKSRPKVAKKAARTSARTNASRRPSSPRSKRAQKGGPATKPIRRRDGAGHIAPDYAADLLAKSGARDDDGGGAFLSRPRSRDDLAEELGEDFVHEATSGEAESQDARDQVVSEELGGPFVLSTGGTEFAEGTDESNPKDAAREPFPTT